MKFRLPKSLNAKRHSVLLYTNLYEFNCDLMCAFFPRTNQFRAIRAKSLVQGDSGAFDGFVLTCDRCPPITMSDGLSTTPRCPLLPKFPKFVVICVLLKIVMASVCYKDILFST